MERSGAGSAPNVAPLKINMGIWKPIKLSKFVGEILIMTISAPCALHRSLY